MNDYVIAFDASGQPYISHAFWNRNKGGQKKEHKYIQRIKDKNGLWRYFYDQAEWDAYVRGDKNKTTTLGGKIKDKLGYDERERKSNALHKLMDADDKKYAAEQEYNKAQENVDKYYKFGSFIKRNISKKSAEEFEKARDKRDKAANEMWEAQREHEKADREYDNAIRKYKDTPLGKIDIARENLDNAKDVISDAADQTLTAAILYADKVEGNVNNYIKDRRDEKWQKEDKVFLDEIGKKATKLANRTDDKGRFKTKEKYTWYGGYAWETDKLVDHLNDEINDLYDNYQKAESSKERKKLREDINAKFDLIDQLVL